MITIHCITWQAVATTGSITTTGTDHRASEAEGFMSDRKWQDKVALGHQTKVSRAWPCIQEDEQTESHIRSQEDSLKIRQRDAELGHTREV